MSSSSWNDFYHIQDALHYLSSDGTKVVSSDTRSNLLYLRIDQDKGRLNLHSHVHFVSGDHVTKYEGYVISKQEYDELPKNNHVIVEIIPGKWYLDGNRYIYFIHTLPI